MPQRGRRCGGHVFARQRAGRSALRRGARAGEGQVLVEAAVDGFGVNSAKGLTLSGSFPGVPTADLWISLLGKADVHSKLTKSLRISSPSLSLYLSLCIDLYCSPLPPPPAKPPR